MNALRKLFGLRVLAVLDDGTAIDGKLESADADWILYTEATLIPEGPGEHIPMDGTQFIARMRVIRLQVP